MKISMPIKKPKFSWLWLLVFGIVFAALGVYIIYLTMAASYAPVYRYFNSANGDHFYNLTKSDYTGYKYEGIAFYALPTKALKSVAIYQYYNKQTGDHLYEKKVKSLPGYVNEGVAFHVYGTALSGSFPVYRYWNATVSDSLYERTKTSYVGYTYDKIAFYAMSGTGILPLSTTNSPEPAYVTTAGVTGSAVTDSATTTTASPNNPVYRFYSAALGSHFYSTSATEGTAAGYAYEGVAFYAYASQVTGTIPVYRFFNSAKGSHFYSTSATEGTAAGYAYEGVAFYAMSTSTTTTTTVDTTVSSDLTRAQTALQGYINKCPNYLTGATVTIDASIPSGYIAITYYTSKRIIINPNWDAMTASTLENIINHEVWHIIDFAIDSKIDWGEYIPPATTAWPACMK